MQPNYYDFNVRFPIYETNILNLTNVKHPDADFSLHENLERMILETGDEMKKSTNVKADMTNWTMHKTHTGFKQLADMVMSIAGQLTKTKPPLYGLLLKHEKQSLKFRNIIGVFATLGDYTHPFQG